MQSTDSTTRVVQIRALYVLSVVSGIGGIIYEVLYLRLITPMLGDMFYVHVVLLAVFLAGNGLGAKLAHRFVRKLWLFEISKRIEALLRQAVEANVAGMSGSCKDILAHQQALWTFISTEDVQPTNNLSERMLRALVLWRRRSFGSQSARGSVFVEVMLTIAKTAQMQALNVLDFLTHTCRAHLDGSTRPSLLSSQRSH